MPDSSDAPLLDPRLAPAPSTSDARSASPPQEEERETPTPGDRARASSIVAAIPFRDLETAKSRLGEALDPEERQELVLRLLSRTIRAASEARTIDAVVVVSRDSEVLALAAKAGVWTLRQRSVGLGPGLEEAREWAIARDATGLLVVPADLPAVRSDILDALVERGLELLSSDGAAGRVAVLVPDRRGEGTNTLLLIPPDAMPFEFGAGSRARHRTSAAARGTLLVEFDGPLSLDVDTPEDLLDAEAAGSLGVGV